MQDMAFPGALLDGQHVDIDVARLRDLPALSGFAATNFRSADSSIWRAVIPTENAVCARARDGSLAGFYLVNHLGLLESSEAVHAALNVLCNRFKLLSQSVAFGAQAAIESRFQHSDLRLHLLRALLRNVGLRYRYLFTSVNKNDAFEMLALPSEGWRCFHEEDEVCYMALNVSQTLRQLPSRLMLRPPRKPGQPLHP